MSFHQKMLLLKYSWKVQTEAHYCIIFYNETNYIYVVSWDSTVQYRLGSLGARLFLLTVTCKQALGHSVASYQVCTSSFSSMCTVIKSTSIWTENRWLLYTLSTKLTYIFLLLNTSAHFWFSWDTSRLHLCVFQ